MTETPVHSRQEIGARAVRGSMVQVAGQLVSQALRLASNLVMTRLLEPDAFGLMQIVLAIVIGLQLVSDVGVYQAIIRSKRGDERAFLDTGFTMHVVRGVMLFAIGAACAVPAYLTYHRSEFLLLLPVASVQLLILGFESSNVASNNRNLHVGRVMLLEIAAQAIALAVSVPLALWWKSVWALIVAVLISAVVRVVLSHTWLQGGRNRLRWEKEAVAEILVFGRWVFISTMIYFFCSRWDVFAVGKLKGMEILGVYAGIALLIVSVPVNIGDRVVGSILTPLLSHSFRADPEGFNASLNKALTAVLPAVSVLFIGAALTAPAFVKLAYRPVFHDAAWMAQLLLVCGWLVFVQSASTFALVAIGDSKSIAATNAVRLVATAVASVLLYQAFDIVGFILGLSIGAAAGCVAAWVALRRHGMRVALVSAVTALMGLGIAALGCGLPWWVSTVVAWPREFLTLASVVVVLAPYAFVVLTRARRTLRAGI